MKKSKQKLTQVDAKNLLFSVSDLTVKNINQFLMSGDKEKLAEEVKKISDTDLEIDIQSLQTLVNASYAEKNKVALYSLYPVIVEKVNVTAKGADKLFLLMIKKIPADDSSRGTLVDMILGKGFQNSLIDVYTLIIEKSLKNSKGLISLYEVIIELVQSDKGGASVLSKLVNKVKDSELSAENKNELFQKVIKKGLTKEICPVYGLIIEAVKSDKDGADVLNKLVNKVKDSGLPAENKNELFQKVIKKDLIEKLIPAYEVIIESVKSDIDGADVLNSLVNQVKDSALPDKKKDVLFQKVIKKTFTNPLKETFKIIRESTQSSSLLIELLNASDGSSNISKSLARRASQLDKATAQAVFSKLLKNEAAKKKPEVINIIGNFVLPKAKANFNGQTGAKFTFSCLSALISGVLLIQNALVSAVAMGAVGGFMLLTRLIFFLIERANPAKAWVQYVMPLLEVGLTALVVYYLPALLPLVGFSFVMSPQMWLLMAPVGASCLTRWLCQLCTSDRQLNTAYNNVLASSQINEDGDIQITSYKEVSKNLQTLMDKTGPSAKPA